MFFENSSRKGISGQNMSDPLKWSLTDDSRFFQAAILKKVRAYMRIFCTQEHVNVELHFSVIIFFSSQTARLFQVIVKLSRLVRVISRKNNVMKSQKLMYGFQRTDTYDLCIK